MKDVGFHTQAQEAKSEREAKNIRKKRSPELM